MDGLSSHQAFALGDYYSTGILSKVLSERPFIALQTLNEPAPFHRPFRLQPPTVSQSSPDPPSARAEYGRPKKRRGVLEVVNEFEVVHGHALVHRTVLG